MTPFKHHNSDCCSHFSDQNDTPAVAHPYRHRPAPGTSTRRQTPANGPHAPQTGAGETSKPRRRVPRLPQGLQAGRLQPDMRRVHAARLRGLRQLQQDRRGRGRGRLEVQRVPQETAIAGGLGAGLVGESPRRAHPGTAEETLGSQTGRGRGTDGGRGQRVGAAEESGAEEAFGCVAGLVEGVGKGKGTMEIDLSDTLLAIKLYKYAYNVILQPVLHKHSITPWKLF